MKITIRELQKIIKEEIEYALLEETVELEEANKVGVGAAALATAISAVAGAKPIPIKIVDDAGKTVIARTIEAKDERDALSKAQSIANKNSDAGNKYFAEPSTEKEIKDFNLKVTPDTLNVPIASKEGVREVKGNVVTVAVKKPIKMTSMGVDYSDVKARDMAVAALKSKSTSTGAVSSGEAKIQSRTEEGDLIIYKIAVK